MLLLGAIGWGLLAFGATTHVWHHRRLRELLAMHVDHERVPALALTCVEVALALLLPLALWVHAIPVTPIAIVAAVLALGFCAWILRLLLTKSELPCACSFANTPTTIWSLGRAVAALSVAALIFAADEGAAMTTATLTVGWALAAAIFVLPDALAWPAPSRALLERAKAHRPVNRTAAP